MLAWFDGCLGSTAGQEARGSVVDILASRPNGDALADILRQTFLAEKAGNSLLFALNCKSTSNCHYRLVRNCGQG